jgi:hypothetical protein
MPPSTSSTTPERARGSVDSDSATTRLPTSKAMLTPDLFVLLRIASVSHGPQPLVPDCTARTLLNMLAAGLRHWTFTHRPLDPGGVLQWLGDGCSFGRPRLVAGAGSSQ